MSGSSLIVRGYITKSSIEDKVSNCKFTYTSCKKILAQLRGYHTLKYKRPTKRCVAAYRMMKLCSLSDIKLLDHIVTDLYLSTYWQHVK